MSETDFIFCLHNHQPVDNFDEVFQQAYADAYLPMIEALERRPRIRFCAHYSGPLLEWLRRNHLDFFIRLRRLVDEGRLELVGGGFYEPIFSMLPEGDLLGQIEMMQDFLLRNFGVRPEGAWIPERVWEPHLPGVLARAGVRYVILDDSHFRAAGLLSSDLRGHYLTEDRGSLLSVFPGSEALRYTIPFQEPTATAEHLLSRPGSAVVYADDGEKFGLWPGTKKHCWEEGWVDRFLDLLEREDRIRTVHFRDAMHRPPIGRVYFPTASYREMGEWALLTQGHREYREAVDDLNREGRLGSRSHFFLGGTWRNFRVKYPEANLMYGRMLDVSRRLAESGDGNEEAVRELYRAQCNCGYWHGVFGGLYLPLLRGSIYHHLLRAELGLDRTSFGIRRVDLDLDGRDEIRIYNPHLNLFLRPHGGGHLLELDVRSKALNLFAILARRPEHYHGLLSRAVTGTEGGEVLSIHDAVRSKGEGMERHLKFDPHVREGFIDHFLSPEAGPTAVESGQEERGDFVQGDYTAEASTEEEGSRVRLHREGILRFPEREPVPFRVIKEFYLPSEVQEFEVSYQLTNLGKEGVTFRFAVEFPLALCGSQLPTARFHTGPGTPAGAPGVANSYGGPNLYFQESRLGFDLQLVTSFADGFWTFPVETVSQSEAGFELNYQGTVVVVHRQVTLEAGRTWSGVISPRFEFIETRASASVGAASR